MNHLLIVIISIAFIQSGGVLVFAQNSNNSQAQNERIYESKEVDRRAEVTKMPEVVYTEEARRNRVEGTVRLSVILRASGEVGDIVVLRSLPHGLNEEAIRAAKKIKFRPAIKDGRPVQFALRFSV